MMIMRGNRYGPMEWAQREIIALCYTEHRAFGTRAETGVQVTTDQRGRMRRGNVRSPSLEPENGSRDRGRLKAGELDFRSRFAEEQPSTTTSRAVDAARTTSVGGADDWRKMNIESSSIDNSASAQRSQHPATVSNHRSLQATTVKTSSR